MNIEIIGAIVAAVAVIAYGLTPGKTEKTSGPVAVIPTIAGLGDSTLWGCVGAGRLDVPPCVRINELANGCFVIDDYSWGGCTSRMALEGVEHFPPLIPFAQWVPTISETYVLFKYGGADAFLEDHGLPEDARHDALKGRLIELVTLTRKAGKTPILVTTVRSGVPETSGFSEWDDVIRGVSAGQNVSLIDVSKNVQFGGIQDLCIDKLHAGQAYSDRIAAHIVQELHLITRA